MSGDGIVSAGEATALDVAESFAAADPENSRSRTLVWQDPVATAAAGAEMSGIGLEAKFVRPITRQTGRVLCEASVVYRGRRQATSQAVLTAAGDGKLLAHGTATCMILGG